MGAFVISLVLRFSRAQYRFIEKVLGCCRAQLRGERVPLRYRPFVALTQRNVRGYATTVCVNTEHTMELLHFMQALFHDLATLPSEEWAMRFVKYQDEIATLARLNGGHFISLNQHRARTLGGERGGF